VKHEREREEVSEDEEALPGIDFADWEAKKAQSKTWESAAKREHVE
jgi:hypothetical protein